MQAHLPGATWACKLYQRGSKGIPAKGGHEPVTEDGSPLTLPGCIQPMRVACFLAQLLLVPPPALSHCIGLYATGVLKIQCLLALNSGASISNNNIASNSVGYMLNVLW